MKIIITIFALILSSIVVADNVAEVSGMYLRYEGGEYESAFTPCGGDEVWSIEGGLAYDELVAIYEEKPKNQYGELFVTLTLLVKRIDKTKYPNSHYERKASVSAVKISNQVSKCKNALTMPSI